MVGFHGGGTDFPINGDRLDLGGGADQALVEQITQHQPLRVRAQGHQRDEFALVHINGERTLSGDLELAGLAVLVDDLDRAGERRECLR